MCEICLTCKKIYLFDVQKRELGIPNKISAQFYTIDCVRLPTCLLVVFLKLVKVKVTMLFKVLLFTVD